MQGPLPRLRGRGCQRGGRTLSSCPGFRPGPLAGPEGEGASQASVGAGGGPGHQASPDVQIRHLAFTFQET